MTMSASYFNLLKYAATGQASPDMTYYDRMRASTLMGGATVKTLTGQPPLTFKADGTPLISWSMKGNGSQPGTPTPDNPVMPEFVGVRTGNLFDKSSATIYKAYINDQGYWLPSDDSRSVKIPCVPNTRYTLSIPQSIAVFRIYETSDSSALPSDQTVLNRLVRSQDRSQSTFTTGANAAAIIFQGSSSAVDTWFNGLMLNAGSTALPYEPFGWAEKITCGGQTVPIYLGEVPTVRMVKKFVLTGQEQGWVAGQAGGGAIRFRLLLSDITIQADTQRPTSKCTHFPLGVEGGTWNYDNVYTISYANDTWNLLLRVANISTLNNLQQYLRDEYAAGHPVTVWYVLATPETGIVNEPLAKIGDYADELHSTDAGVTIPTAKGENTLTVETELQPSEMTITYKG